MASTSEGLSLPLSPLWTSAAFEVLQRAPGQTLRSVLLTFEPTLKSKSRLARAWSSTFSSDSNVLQQKSSSSNNDDNNNNNNNQSGDTLSPVAAWPLIQEVFMIMSSDPRRCSSGECRYYLLDVHWENIIIDEGINIVTVIDYDNAWPCRVGTSNGDRGEERLLLLQSCTEKMEKLHYLLLYNLFAVVVTVLMDHSLVSTEELLELEERHRQQKEPRPLEVALLVLPAEARHFFQLLDGGGGWLDARGACQPQHGRGGDEAGSSGEEQRLPCLTVSTASSPLYWYTNGMYEAMLTLCHRRHWWWRHSRSRAWVMSGRLMERLRPELRDSQQLDSPGLRMALYWGLVAVGECNTTWPPIFMRHLEEAGLHQDFHRRP